MQNLKSIGWCVRKLSCIHRKKLSLSHKPCTGLKIVTFLQTFQYEGFTVAIQEFFYAFIRYLSITYAISKKLGEEDRTFIFDQKNFSFLNFTHFERCCVLSKHDMIKTDKIDERSIRFWAMFIKVLRIYVENEPTVAPQKKVNNF